MQRQIDRRIRRGLKAFLAVCTPLVLASCFTSETALIPAGEAVLPVDGPITICMETNKPCFEMAVDGDGYRTGPERDEDEQGQARFYPLTQGGDRQVYILEAKGSDDPGFVYLLARRAHLAPLGEATFDIAAITCSDLSEEAEALFDAAGGVRTSGFVGECRAPDLATLKATLVTSFAGDLGDEIWWAENGPE